MPQYLYHFSEDPSIEVFIPRVAPTQQVVGAYVWADAEETSPRYWFPRDCPRATWWRGDGSDRVHAIQWDWLDRFIECELYAYRFDAAPFSKNPEGGGWRTTETVEPLGVEAVGPLLGGRGGGKDDVAQGGGNDPSRIDDALGLVETEVARAVGES